MKDVVMYPLIGSNILIASCIAATLLLASEPIMDPDEEVRQALLEITCQEYYSSTSELDRMFLSMLICDLVDMEQIGKMTNYEHAEVMEEIYIRILNKCDELLQSKHTYQD